MPIMLIVAILIKLDDPKNPILFKQDRPGKNARIFTLYKFRTMKIETEKDGKVLNDFQRITKLGYYLRKMSIDELPQLINILKGEMSFIGPRPLLVEYLQHYTPYEMRRHDVKPGITGWAQVNGRNAISWEQKFELDIWYIDNVSFKLDLKIIFLTIINVLKSEGINSTSNLTMPRFKESESN
jgi:lipopolysaccharide/colanic/teichoic acid biosynthesis glycosyltransferase